MSHDIIDIARLREETPFCRNVIHFNNASASPMPQPAYERLVTYLQREKEIGGYEAEAEHQPEIKDAYRKLADLIGARPSELALVGSASRAFETWESNPASTLALGEAAAYAQNVGLEAIWQRVQELTRYPCQRLRELPGAKVQGRGQTLSGIVAFTLESVPPLRVKECLGECKINVHTSSAQGALLDMQDWGVSEVVRASVHYFNTEEEVATVVRILAELLVSRV